MSTRTRRRQVKPLLIRVAALTNRTLRELLEVQYQFAEPFIVDSSKIGNTLGVRATHVETLPGSSAARFGAYPSQAEM